MSVRRRTSTDRQLRMALATPPPATRTPPEPSSTAPAPPRRLRVNQSGLAAKLLGGLFGLLLIALLASLLLSGSEGYEYRLLFNSAEVLVKGNTVQVGGVPVGTVRTITLSKNYEAEVEIEVNAPLAPLHRGTTAEIKYLALSGVADRYVALNPGPNNYPPLPAGATIHTAANSSPTDLDEVLSALNPPTRKGLQQLIEGFSQMYSGNEAAANTTTHYLAPSLRSLSHVFAELAGDERTFSAFLVNAAEATSVIGARSAALRNLIGNAATTFQAVGSEQGSLRRGLRQLPVALTQGNRAFSELHSPLAALRHLVDVSKLDTKRLPLFLERLRPLLAEAAPVVENLSTSIRRPGAENDFTDAAQQLPQLASTLESASPAAVRAERESLPNTAFFGPYAPELIGLLRNFGQSTAYYDASGHYAHVLPVYDSFKLGEGSTLTPTTPQRGMEGLKTGQLRRCPGAAGASAADGSTPFTDGGLLGCIASEVP